MKALLIVDVQNDFCPGGALPAPEGDKVVPVINRIMSKFPVIVASKDWHPEKTVHFDIWPRHCVQGTKGAELHPGLVTNRIDRIVLKGMLDQEEGYSVFEGIDVDLEKYLRDRNVDEVYVTGLVTEYCVRETAVDAAKRGFRTYVIKDAVKAVGDPEKAFEEMKKAGVKFLLSSEL